MKIFNVLLCSSVLSFMAVSASAVERNSFAEFSSFSFAAPVVTNEPSATENPVGSIIYDLNTSSYKGLFQNGTWAGLAQGANAAPTVQIFTSSSGTYTTPAGVLYIRVKMVGGGGGGAGSAAITSNDGSAGSSGGQTTFGSSLLVANGGSGGNGGANNPGGAGGTASLGSGPIGQAISGGIGAASVGVAAGFNGTAGAGGATPFGGAGQSNGGGTAGTAAVPNSGSGGGGSGDNSAPGSGGGAGGYINAIITNPAATYAYAVGASGSGGSAGTSGSAGGAGGSGVILVEEYYQ